LYENYLFSASLNSTVAQFDKKSGNLIRKFSVDFPNQVNSIAVSEDGQWLFIGSQDPNAHLVQWRLSDGSRERTLEGSLIWLISNDLHRT
jgi:WD40 repeat protein